MPLSLFKGWDCSRGDGNIDMDVIFNIRDHCLSGVHGTLGNDTDMH